jgi:hypothetical protein
MPRVSALDRTEDDRDADALGVELGGDRERRRVLEVDEDVRGVGVPLERDRGWRRFGDRVHELEPDLAQPAFARVRKERKQAKIGLVDLQVFECRIHASPVNRHRIPVEEVILQHRLQGWPLLGGDLVGVLAGVVQHLVEEDEIHLDPDDHPLVFDEEPKINVRTVLRMEPEGRREAA